MTLQRRWLCFCIALGETIAYLRRYCAALRSRQCSSCRWADASAARGSAALSAAAATMMTMLVVDLHHPRPRASKISFYVKVPNLTDAEISEASPAPGQTTTVSEEGTVLVDGETYKTRSATVSTGPATVANSGTLICEGSDCESGPDKEYQGFEVKQAVPRSPPTETDCKLHDDRQVTNGYSSCHSSGESATCKARTQRRRQQNVTGAVHTSAKNLNLPHRRLCHQCHFFVGRRELMRHGYAQEFILTVTYLGSVYGLPQAPSGTALKRSCRSHWKGDLTADFGSRGRGHPLRSARRAAAQLPGELPARFAMSSPCRLASPGHLHRHECFTSH